MKLRKKILSYTLPLILIPFLLMALTVYYFVIRANQIQTQEENRQSLNEAIVSFGQEIDSARKDISLIANVPAVGDYLQTLSGNKDLATSISANREKSAKAVLKLFFEQNPYYLQLSLVNKRGQELIKFSKFPNQQELKLLRKEDYFRRTLISGSVQSPAREIQPNKYATVFTKGIVEKDEFIGMVVLILNTKVFERAMRPLLKRGLATFLFDDRGFVLASGFNSINHKDLLKEIVLEDEALKLLKKPAFESSQRIVSNGENGFLLSFLPSESFVRTGTLEKQAGGNWFLGVLEPQEASSIPINFQILFFSILLLAFGAVLWATARVSRRITIPLERVSAATGKIARGESDLNLDVKTGDEVEDLARAFTKMSGELRDYQKQIVQSAKLATMGEMTSEISHEIQNRISGISLWLQHLDSEIDLGDPRREYLDEMKQGLSGFMEMLSGLKEHYKTPVLDLNAIDLNKLAEETMLFVGEKVDEKQADVVTDFEPDIPGISGDEEKLKGVILNLLLNALDSIKEKGKVEIRTSVGQKRGGERVVLEVIDTGSGIDQKDLSRIFYPFYSTKSGGSGLGLAISSNIITAHKGTIEVESEVGKGSTFKITFAVLGTQATRLQ